MASSSVAITKRAAKCLASTPQVLIVDDDVGAKAEIHTLMRELVSKGLAILVISGELPRLAGELSFDEASEERIMVLAALETAERATT